MSKYLISTTEVYRVDSENEVNQLVEEAKTDERYNLQKYTCVQKELKQKGEVIDTWFKVSLTKAFTEEKDPLNQYEINYKPSNY